MATPDASESAIKTVQNMDTTVANGEAALANGKKEVLEVSAAVPANPSFNTTSTSIHPIAAPTVNAHVGKVNPLRALGIMLKRNWILYVKRYWRSSLAQVLFVSASLADQSLGIYSIFELSKSRQISLRDFVVTGAVLFLALAVGFAAGGLSATASVQQAPTGL